MTANSLLDRGLPQPARPGARRRVPLYFASRIAPSLAPLRCTPEWHQAPASARRAGELTMRRPHRKTGRLRSMGPGDSRVLRGDWRIAVAAGNGKLESNDRRRIDPAQGSPDSTRIRSGPSPPPENRSRNGMAALIISLSVQNGLSGSIAAKSSKGHHHAWHGLPLRRRADPRLGCCAGKSSVIRPSGDDTLGLHWATPDANLERATNDFCRAFREGRFGELPRWDGACEEMPKHRFRDHQSTPLVATLSHL
jgi:hypothetical protein